MIVVGNKCQVEINNLSTVSSTHHIIHQPFNCSLSITLFSTLQSRPATPWRARYVLRRSRHSTLLLIELQEFKAFRSIHEFLTAVHIYTGEAEEGKTRYVEATNYSQVGLESIAYIVCSVAAKAGQRDGRLV